MNKFLATFIFIFFSSSIIYAQNSYVKIAAITADATNPDFFASLAWLYYVLFILGLVAIGFFVWKYFFNRKSEEEKIPIDKIYQNGNKTLSDFANENAINLLELLSFNKDVIDQKYIKYKEPKRKEVQNKLKGRRLIVGYQSKVIISYSPNDVSDTKIEEPANSKEEVITQPIDIENNVNISQQLQQIHSDIINEIRQAGSKGNNSNELNKLQSELTAIKKDKNKLDSDFEQLKTDKDILQQNFDSITAEKERNITELNQLQEKVIAVDYLASYCESVLVYFNLSNKVSEDAFDFFSRLSKQTPEKANIAGLLLANYQKSINSLPVGNWIQMIQDIKETGVTNNKRIRSSFKQLTSTEEKKKQFQRMLFSEVLVKYSSSILILTEVFSHIHRLLGSLELVGESNIFVKHVSELVNKVKPTGLENKYVPLFKNFEEFLGHTELANREKSFAYKGIAGLEKDAIAEIVSYGVKTPFEDTKTLIILS